MASNCPCGSETNYDSCCAPLHKGEAVAQTAEQLMRARYAAFETQNLDFLETSLSEASRKDYDGKATEEWATQADWIGLEILDTEQGTQDDQEGYVEFKAHFKIKEHQTLHHERSHFKKIDGCWYYHDGEIVNNQQPVRVTKIGRNDPCSCGSGKKYKKCCGAH